MNESFFFFYECLRQDVRLLTLVLFTREQNRKGLEMRVTGYVIVYEENKKEVDCVDFVSVCGKVRDKCSLFTHEWKNVRLKLG